MKAIQLILFTLLVCLRCYSQQFVPVNFSFLSGGRESAVSWGDYDGDDDLDFVLTSKTTGNTNDFLTCIYRNDGGNQFTDIAPQNNIIQFGMGDTDWGDYDNDGDLDLIISGFCQVSPYCNTRIYRNDGSDVFTLMPITNIAGVYIGKLQWVDFDNDGDLDIAVIGTDINGVSICRIYRNNNGSTFTIVNNSGIIDLGFYAAMDWADIDLDGDMDVFCEGFIGPGQLTSYLYLNTGNGIFISIPHPFINVYFATVEWGDYDSDGDPDLLLAGYDLLPDSFPTTKIYQNDGNGSFTDIQAAIPGVFDVIASWGDFDNDGDLDVLLAGDSVYVQTNQGFCRLYWNMGNNQFVLSSEQFSSVNDGSADIGDYDNDGDLDFLLAGYDGYSGFTMLYENTITSPNNLPALPTGLISVAGNGSLTMTWNRSSDTETPSNGLSYNIILGEIAGGNEVVSPHSDPFTGQRYVHAVGNAGQDTTWVISGLTTGTYYWSVQAIDNCYAASAFSTYQTVMVTSINEIRNYVSSELFPNPFQSEARLSFSSVLPEDSRLVIINSTSQVLKNNQVGNMSQITLTSNDLPTGMYIYMIYSGGLILSKGNFVIQ